LHWYIATKENKLDESTKERLAKFSYETRTSSREFCKEIVAKGVKIDDVKAISCSIKNTAWFVASWEKDATISAMLIMLDAIQAKFKDITNLWDKLTDEQNPAITFLYIKLENFGLSDDLYIKMNSRGKPLTSFENFKAQFSELLSSKDTDFTDEKLDYENTHVTFQEYFAFKIDSVWTDLFWNFVLQKKEGTVDDCLMNFFTYIAQICFFKDNTDKETDDFKNNDFSVFKQKKNVVFLFAVLDWFYEISLDESQILPEKIEDFFAKLFQNGKIDDNYQGQVRLFDGKGINLFAKCLLEGSDFDNRNRIILFCILSYVIKYNLTDANDDLRYFIRVVRNLLQATRQRNETVYNTNVRINSFGNYWKLFEQLFAKPNVYQILLGDVEYKKTDIREDALANEIEKAKIIVGSTTTSEEKVALFKLEEFEYFGGLIHQLKPSQEIDKLVDYSQAIREIWSKNNDDSLIIGALIACGFDGFYTKNCKLGGMRFFGRNDRWYIVLTGNSGKDEEISKAIISVLDKYLLYNSTIPPNKKLQCIIDEYLKNNPERKFQYYFLKYPLMLSRSNYFAWNGNFEIRILSSESGNPLLAYHINPYVLVVSNLLDESICEERYCYNKYGNYQSGLHLKNNMDIFCKEDGWQIELNNQTIPEGLKTKYNLDDTFILKDTKEKDRIEIAVEFCTELFK
jgi:hypothetical protein